MKFWQKALIGAGLVFAAVFGAMQADYYVMKWRAGKSE